MDRISRLTAGALAVNPNTMYPLLRTLEAKGLIAGEWEHPERRSRRFYRITGDGEAERARLAGEVAPKLDAVAASVDLIRRELDGEADGPRPRVGRRAGADRRRRGALVRPRLAGRRSSTASGSVARVDAGWPATGATLIWDSRPGGRGRVVERVTRYEARVGQTSEVEDERLRGTQTVGFAALEDGVEVSLELEYQLKESGPLRAVTDVLFIRRALGDSLRRTLARFARELAADRELLR